MTDEPLSVIPVWWASYSTDIDCMSNSQESASSVMMTRYLPAAVDLGPLLALCCTCRR